MKNILVIAPHADDEILGVGGTIVNTFKNHLEYCIDNDKRRINNKRSFNKTNKK